MVAVFTLGASADSFLLLRLLNLGLPVAWAPVVWLTLNASKAATNIPGGKLSDRMGRRRTLVLAWVVYGVAYAAFPLTRSVALTWALIVGYGVYYGLAEGGEKSNVPFAVLAPANQRGRAFGALHTLTRSRGPTCECAVRVSLPEERELRLRCGSGVRALGRGAPGFIGCRRAQRQRGVGKVMVRIRPESRGN